MSTKRFFPSRVFCLAWLALTGGLLAGADDLGSRLSGYVPGPKEDASWSVFVGKDFMTGGNAAELEGRAFVRGDFWAGKPNYVVGRAGGGSKVVPPLDVPTLVVAGSILGSGGINLPKSPSIQVGGTIASTVSFTDLGAVITGGVDTASADLLLAELHAKSLYWATLPDTAGGSVTSRWGGVYFAADGQNGNPKTWVFNLDFDLSASFWGVEFSGFEEGDSILVNCRKKVGGESFVLGVSSYAINGRNLNSPFAPKLLWNIPEAETVTVSGYAALQGSVLVGNPASLTTVSVSVHDGRFITCGSAVHNGSGGEFHNYPFTGSLPDLPRSRLSGRVSIDADRTGSWTDADVPADGVRVSLYTDPDADGDPSDGVCLQTVVADAGGAYAFDALPPGHYVVAVSVTPGSVLSTVSATLGEGGSADNDVLCEIDPSGFFYDSSNGRVVPGGRVSVPGAVVKLDGRTGEYLFVTTNRLRATYVMTVVPPAGYVLDATRPVAGASFSPAGLGDPVVLGSGLQSGGNGFLADGSAAANPYYLTFELGEGDPFVLNNNIPLTRTGSLSSQLDLEVYASGGTVKIDVWTVNESGVGDITVYAWIDGEWVEVARVPASQVVGEGSNRYTVQASGLATRGAFRFMIVDEAGFEHVLNGKRAVKRIQLSAVRKVGGVLTLDFSAEKGRRYRVQTSSDLKNWSEQPSCFPTVHGWSEPSAEAFTASDDAMQVRVPVDGRRQAFFRIERTDD